MEIKLVAIVTCEKCKKQSNVSDLDIYNHEWDEYDSEMRCEGKFNCPFCGFAAEFRIGIY